MPGTAVAARRRCEDPPSELLVKGIEQFNRGEFYAQHETLEELWRAEAGPVRGLYQGILQVGVAFYQLDRGNFHGATTMLDRGARHLQRLPPRCQGVDVAALRADAVRALEALRAGGPGRVTRFDRSLVPVIRFDAPMKPSAGVFS